MRIDGKKLLKRFGWTVLGLVTLTALFFTIENWRGARAWEKVRARLVEEGEPLTFTEIVPAPIPADQNICAIPLIASLTDFEETTTNDRLTGQTASELVYHRPQIRDQFLAMKLPDKSSGFSDADPPKMSDHLLGRPIDLGSWADYLDSNESFELGDPALPAAERILLGYAPFAPLLDEITAAAHARTGAQLPFKVGETYPELVSMSMPHLSAIRDFSRFIALRTEAAIATGNTELARDGLLIQFRLAEACGSQPTLITHLFQITLVRQAINSIWNGLREHRWTLEDLQWIDGQLAQIDLTLAATRAFRGELAFYLGGIQWIKSLGLGDLKDMTGKADPQDPIAMLMPFGLIPKGWLDQNAAVGATLLFETAILPLKNRTFSDSVTSQIEELQRSRTPYNLLAAIFLPAIDSVLVKSIHSQTTIELARGACALERHFLQLQTYPDTLDALVPNLLTSLPQDPMTQQPLLYQKEDNGFLLYSVGWNLQDDGGKLEMQNEGRQDLKIGDWVWRN